MTRAAERLKVVVVRCLAQGMSDDKIVKLLLFHPEVIDLDEAELEELLNPF